MGRQEPSPLIGQSLEHIIFSNRSNKILYTKQGDKSSTRLKIMKQSRGSTYPNINNLWRGLYKMSRANFFILLLAKWARRLVICSAGRFSTICFCESNARVVCSFKFPSFGFTLLETARGTRIVQCRPTLHAFLIHIYTTILLWKFTNNEKSAIFTK